MSNSTTSTMQQLQDEAVAAIEAARLVYIRIGQLCADLESLQFADAHYETLRQSTIDTLYASIAQAKQQMDETEESLLGALSIAVSLVKQDARRSEATSILDSPEFTPDVRHEQIYPPHRTEPGPNEDAAPRIRTGNR